jgi:chaperonin GroEL (HSP60 family)
VTRNGDSPAADDDADLTFPQANIAPVGELGDLLGTTLGPVSSDKLIVDPADPGEEADPTRSALDDIVISNDGASILEYLPLQHPVSPIIRRIVGPERPGDTDVKGKDIHEGITTAVVLTSSLLDEASRLIEMGVHPQSIHTGYQEALETALDVLDRERIPIEAFDDPRRAQIGVASTSMTGNVVGGVPDQWFDFVVDAVEQVGMPDEHSFLVRTTSAGSIDDSRFVRGTVLDRNKITHGRMPKRVEDARVLVLGGHRNGHLGDREPNRKSAIESIDLQSADQLEEYESIESERKRRLVEEYQSIGADVVVTQLGIDTEFQKLFADRGIATVRRVTKRNLTSVTRATGATAVLNPEDVSSEDLGHAGVVEEITGGTYSDRRKRRRMVLFDECRDPDSVSILLAGLQNYVDDQLERQLRKAAKSVAEARGDGEDTDVDGVVPGAGAIQCSMARGIRDRKRAGAKSQLAVDAYADALESIVRQLAVNAGRDPLPIVSDLRAAHEAGDSSSGFVLPEGSIRDSVDANVLDPAASVRRGLVTATHVSNMILNIDDAIDAVHIEEERDPDDVIYDDQAEKTESHLEGES